MCARYARWQIGLVCRLRFLFNGSEGHRGRREEDTEHTEGAEEEGRRGYGGGTQRALRKKGKEYEDIC